MKDSLLTDYFKRSRRGRPKKRGNLVNDTIEVVPHKNKRHGPAQKKKAKLTAAPQDKPDKPPDKAKLKVAPFAVSTEAAKQKQTRTNWAKGKAKVQLETAVNEWDEKCDRYFDSNGEALSMRQFSNVVGIPLNTLKKYLATDLNSRRTVGNAVGRPALLTPSDQHFLANCLARKDQGNAGAKPTEAIDFVMDLNPQLSRDQARFHLHRTLLKNHPNQVKAKPKSAQPTTTKRSAITMSQQFRWHTTYGSALDVLRTRNTGVCRLSGKSFGELIQYFVVGGDETYLMACEEGTILVISSAGRKKHEKKSHDSPISITMYRTGSVAGDTGPTIFLLEGKKKKQGFTDSFLIDTNGASVGSTIVITPSAFMTIEAWEQMTPFVCKGLWAINKYVAANPHWIMLEVFDGFGAHLLSLLAMEQ